MAAIKIETFHSYDSDQPTKIVQWPVKISQDEKHANAEIMKIETSDPVAKDLPRSSTFRDPLGLIKTDKEEILNNIKNTMNSEKIILMQEIAEVLDQKVKKIISKVSVDVEGMKSLNR